MFKVGDKVVASDKAMFYSSEEYRVITEIISIFGDESVYILNSDHSTIWYEEELKLYKEEEKMEKTFKEVINTIKEGEVWESKFKKISLDEDGGIVIKSNGSIDNSMVFSLQNLYRLKRNKVDFERALKAYGEGKEIESCISDTSYNINIPQKNLCALYEEIQGDWYIN